MKRLSAWHLELSTVEPLDSVDQHRAVDLGQYLGADLDLQIGSYPQDVRIECGVMELAQGQPIRYEGLAAGI